MTQRFLQLVWRVALILIFVAQPFASIVAGLTALGLLAVTTPFLAAVPVPRPWQAGSGLLTLSYALIIVAQLSATGLSADALYLLNFVALLAPLFIVRHAAQYRGIVAVKTLARIAIAGAFVLLAVGLYDVTVGGLARAGGFFGAGAIKYAHVGLLLLLFSGLTLLPVRSSGNGLVPILAMFAALGAIYISGARGALIAAVPLVGLMLFWGARQLERRQRNVLLGAGVLVFGALVGLASVLFPTATARFAGMGSSLIEIVQTGQSSLASLDIRLNFYHAAFAAFAESPFVGHGWAGAMMRVRELIPVIDYPTMAFATWSQLPHLHNDLLQFAASFGIMGVIALALMLVAPWVGIWQDDALRPHRLYVAGGVTLIALFAGLTDGYLAFDQTLVLHVFCTSLMQGLLRPAGESQLQER